MDKLDAFYDHLFDLYCKAIDNGSTMENAGKCVARIAERIHSGFGWDCDEYRALLFCAKPKRAEREEQR